MRQVHVLVEGATEERLAGQVFQPELSGRGVWLTPVVLKTRRPVVGRRVADGTG